MDIHVPIHSWVEKGQLLLTGSGAISVSFPVPLALPPIPIAMWTPLSNGVVLICLLDIEQRACLATSDKLTGFSWV